PPSHMTDSQRRTGNWKKITCLDSSQHGNSHQPHPTDEFRPSNRLYVRYGRCADAGRRDDFRDLAHACGVPAVKLADVQIDVPGEYDVACFVHLPTDVRHRSEDTTDAEHAR